MDLVLRVCIIYFEDLIGLQLVEAIGQFRFSENHHHFRLFILCVCNTNDEIEGLDDTTSLRNPSYNLHLTAFTVYLPSCHILLYTPPYYCS